MSSNSSCFEFCTVLYFSTFRPVSRHPGGHLTWSKNSSIFDTERVKTSVLFVEFIWLFLRKFVIYFSKLAFVYLNFWSHSTFLLEQKEDSEFLKITEEAITFRVKLVDLPAHCLNCCVVEPSNSVRSLTKLKGTIKLSYLYKFSFHFT